MDIQKAQLDLENERLMSFTPDEFKRYVEWCEKRRREGDQRYNIDPQRPTIARYADGSVMVERLHC